jgi:hypothetical protein
MSVTIDGNLSCPVCGELYHHIRRVGVERDPKPGWREEGIYEGISLVFHVPGTGVRNALRIEIEGECGHGWSLILRQHKGYIEVSTQ